ncbi:MAG: hypothetical protein ACO3O3_04470 [Ilumatobacteraceae bacterium]|jgi:hypothetical protein
MSYNDLYPTEYDITPLTDEDLRAHADPTPSSRGPVTEIEGQALDALEVLEIVSAPLSPFALARLAIRALSALARRAR